MSQPRILVVDDEPMVLRVVQRILEGHGYQVITAGDGQEALEAMENAPPDLIVADINMPRMNGFALYGAVRARPDWTTLPFIFLTARNDWTDELTAKALGAEDYLTKPFRHVELLVTVRSRLERAQAIRQALRDEARRSKRVD